jgi:hypothetical protein
MAAVFRKCLGPCLLVGLHGGAFAVMAHQQVRWDSMLRGSNYELVVSAALLACLGADVGLLGVWAAVSKRHLAVRWLTTVGCLACWCFIYQPYLYFMLRDWSYYGNFGRKYSFYFKLSAVGGFALLTVLCLTAALRAVGRRGVQLRRLTADERQREAGARQFQIMHLLLLATVLSLVLGASVNCRQWLARQSLPAWTRALDAPVNSLETVFFSAFTLAATTLTVVWAALTCGRPWLRLASALLAAGVLGFAWALAFTSSQRQEQLFWNALFSVCVGLSQAALISAALLLARRRGYRMLR